MPELVLEPVWSWPLIALASGALLGVVLLTYPPRVRHLPPWHRRLLLTLRLLAAGVLIFSMLRPAVRYTETDKQSAQLILLADKSRSMSTADGPGGLTRREALLQTIENNKLALEQLAQNVELRFIDFDTELTPVDEFANDTDGPQTAIGRVLEELAREDVGKRLVGIVLMSDGAQRVVGQDTVDPRAAARRLAELRSVPVHTVTFGSSDLTGAGLDLAVEDVIVDPLAYEKKTVPVRFQLRTSGAAGEKVRVRLLLEKPGTPGEFQELPITGNAKPFEEIEIRGNQSVEPRELSFVAEQAGEYKLAVEVVPLDREVKQTNNRYETVVTVLKGGLKVAYFATSQSPEPRFVAELNRNARIQLDVIRIAGGAFLSRQTIDPQLFQPGQYDVYLIGDIPAFVFRQGGEDLLIELARRCEEGAGLAMLGGTFNFGAGGYAGTPLEPLMPVRMSTAERLEIGQVQPPEQYIPPPIRMLPAPDGLNHYLMQVGPRSDQVWASLPSLRDGANRLEPANVNVSVLAWTEQQQPLLIGTDTGRARVLAFAVSDTWRWCLHGYEEVHHRFWEQMLLWLARMENQTDQPVWARVTPRNFSPGDRIPIVVGAQDEQQQPITDAVFRVEVTSPDGRVHPLSAQQAGDESLAEFIDTAEPGDYWVTVSAQKDGQLFGPAARTRFIVDSRDVELDNPAADPDLMAEIATITATVPISPEDFGSFIKDLVDSGLAADVTRYRQTNLWDGWPLLLVFSTLLVAEWFLRKRRGLV